jgi:uncharacterized protein (TIGR00369 family)
MGWPLQNESLSTLRVSTSYIGQMKQDEKNGLAVASGEEIVSDSRCFVCGLNNVGGLQVRFFRKGEDAAEAMCDPEITFMGYDGLLHGGVAASLLDEIMIKAVLAAGRLVVTGRMTVKYHAPITLGSPLRLDGRIVTRRGRVFETEGRIFRGEDAPLATAIGTYVEVTGETQERLMASLRDQRAAGLGG